MLNSGMWQADLTYNSLQFRPNLNVEKNSF